MPRNNDPIYRKIQDDIEQRIRSGSFLPGMQIDSEQQLAEHWGCSRHPVRKALLSLSKRGMVQQRPGRGWFVSNKQLRGKGQQQILCMGWSPSAELIKLCADHGCTLTSHRGQQISNRELLADICNDPDIIGFIAVEMHHADKAFIQALQQQGKHIVLIGLAEAAACDIISLDFFQASVDLVNKAVAQGHQHISFSGRHLHQEIRPFKRRLEGYLFACHQHQLPSYTWLLPRELFDGKEIGNWNAQQLIQNPEVTCCLLDSHATAQCIEAFHEIKAIPNEFCVAGYGNGRLSFRQALPVKSFDAIYEPWDDLHQAAVHRILARINGDSSRPSHTLIPCDFIRGETGVF